MMAERSNTHSFHFGGFKVDLTLTDTWEKKPSPKSPICLRDEAHGSLLQVTPMPLPGPEAFDTHLQAKRSAEQALFRAVESTIEIHAIELPVGQCHYYSVENSIPKPGDWAFMTQDFPRHR